MMAKAFALGWVADGVAWAGHAWTLALVLCVVLPAAYAVSLVNPWRICSRCHGDNTRVRGGLPMRLLAPGAVSAGCPRCHGGLQLRWGVRLLQRQRARALIQSRNS